MIYAASMSLLGAVFPDFAEGKPTQGSSVNVLALRKHWRFSGVFCKLYCVITLGTSMPIIVIF